MWRASGEHLAQRGSEATERSRSEEEVVFAPRVRCDICWRLISGVVTVGKTPIIDMKARRAVEPASKSVDMTLAYGATRMDRP